MSLRRPRRAGGHLACVRGGRAARHHGPERRRQDDLLQRADRPRTSPTAARCASPARTSPACRRARSRGAGIARSFQIMNLFDDFTALDNVDGRAAGVPRPRLRRLPRAVGDNGLRGRGARGARRGRPRRQGARPSPRASPMATGGRSRSPSRSPQRPRLLFLDEPTAGLGAEASRGSPSLIRRLKRRLTIVIIEHDMRFLFGLADTHLGDPLGPGHRQRHARRAAREPVGAGLEPRRLQ